MANLELIGAKLILEDYDAFLSKLDKANKAVLDFGTTGDKAGETFSKGMTRIGASIEGAGKGINVLVKTSSELESVQSSSAKSTAKFGEEQEKSSGIVTKGHEVLSKLGNVVKEAGSHFAKFSTDIAGGFIKGMEQIGSKAIEVTKGLFDLGLEAGKMAGHFATDFIKGSIDAYGEFNAKLQEVKAVSNDVTPAVEEQLKALALDMGARLPISATEAADSFVELAKAGFSADDIMHKFGDSLATLSTAGGLKMGRATEILGGTLRSFGLDANSAKSAVDTLAMAANQSSADISDIAETVKYAGTVAYDAGISLQDFSAATAVMSNNMIKGSMAGTSLRAIITRMATGAGHAGEALTALGIEVNDSSGKMRPFPVLIDELRQKFSKLTQEQQLNYSAQIAGKPAMAGLLSLINTSKGDYDAMTASMNNSTGAAQKMSDTIVASQKGSFEQLGGSINTLQVAFVDKFSGAMQSGLKGVTDLVNAMIPFAKFMGGEMAKAISFAGNALDIFVKGVSLSKVDPAQLSGFQKILYDLGQGVTTVVIPAIERLASIFTSSILPAFAQIVPLAFNFALSLTQQLLPAAEGIGTTFTSKILPAVTQFAQGVLTAVIPVVTSLAKVFQNDIMPAVGLFVQNALPPLLNAFKGVAAFLADPFLPVFGKIASFIIGTVLPTVIDLGTTFITALLPAFTVAVNFVGQTLLPKFQELFGWFQREALPTIKDMATSIGSVLVEAFKVLGPVISVAFDIASTAFKVGFAIFKTGFEVIKTIALDAGNIFTTFGNIVKGVFDGLVFVIKLPLNAVIAAMDVIILGIDSLIDGFNAVSPVKIGGRIPTIPFLASGGIATGPTLAMVGEGKGPEAIVPLDRLVPLLGQAMVQASQQYARPAATAQQMYSSSNQNNNNYSNANHYNLSVNSVRSSESVQSDFRTMQVLAG